MYVLLHFLVKCANFFTLHTSQMFLDSPYGETVLGNPHTVLVNRQILIKKVVIMNKNCGNTIKSTGIKIRIHNNVLHR